MNVFKVVAYILIIQIKFWLHHYISYKKSLKQALIWIYCDKILLIYTYFIESKYRDVRCGLIKVARTAAAVIHRDKIL
jgi:hypothetical protein